ncbi:DNA cytosine methyltransferase [Moraxellaceae bacterium AER2_44_116]|nr:DNA cytosine methyltransferase [Moraxellaceae bacterium]TQC98433.1 DNA cytosine methyltransferase [Moraxellaceae bacterium AER2_44_116]
MIGIDLFAGAGGMSSGARMAGIDVQIVVESDKHAAATYQHNHKPSKLLFVDDIRKFEHISIDRTKPIVVFGGPPCQGFSTSNQRNRSSFNEKNWLFKEFVRVVSLYMPDWIVFENVSGILETANGVFVEHIMRDFRDLGYLCSYQVLQASNYGVPQKRSRFFLVGSLHNQKYKFPEPTVSIPVTVDDAIGDLPILSNGAFVNYIEYDRKAQSEYAIAMRGNLSGCHNHIVTRNSDLVIERYGHISQGGNWESIPDRLMQNYADKSRCHTGIYRRLKNHEPSVVIGNFRKNMLIHPTQDRGLSVREAARIQSFPDDFTFLGSVGFQQQQVGNAVPPMLAKKIFESLML